MSFSTSRTCCLPCASLQAISHIAHSLSHIILPTFYGLLFCMLCLRSIPVAHGSYQQLVDDPSLTAIYVATPNGLHGEWAEAALRAGALRNQHCCFKTAPMHTRTIWEHASQPAVEMLRLA